MILKKAIQLLPSFRNALKYIIPLIMVMELIQLVPNVIFKELIDSLVVFQQSTISYIIFLIALSYGVSIVLTLLESKADMYLVKTIIGAETDLLKASQKKLLELTLQYHEKHHAGRQVTLLKKGVHNLVVLLWNVLFEFTGTGFQLLFSTVIIFWISWKVGFVFLVAIPIVVLYTFFVLKKLQPLRNYYHDAFDESAGKLGEQIANIRTVFDFNQEKKETKTYASLLNKYVNGVMRREKYEKFHSALRDVILQTSRIITLAFSVYLVYVGEITPGSLVLIVTLSEKAYSSIFRFGRTFNLVADAASGVERLVRLHDQKPDITDKENAKLCKTMKGSIAFEDVSFAYEKLKPPKYALKNINFKVKPKEIIALVGKSGGGKSTIIKLLYRHFDVTKGCIKVDGQDIRNFQRESYRNHLSLVSQDIEVFNDTILNNITYGVGKVGFKEVVAAAKMAHAHEFIKDLQKGYKTVVGEKGVKLSGGQKQRLGIARALLRKPSILIFDEATSSLDTHSEKLIQEAMRSISGKQTMIIIAHRLSTIEHADKILVIEDGKLKEIGSHKELMKKKTGLFKSMRKLQKLGEVR